MSAAAVGALTRAAWHQARSYRLSFLMQIGGLLVSIVPLYFIARALQPTMADAISAEANQYFAFVLVGSVSLMLASASLSTLQGAIGGGITSGYFEALLMTRAPVLSILLGLTSYGIVLAMVRSVVMVLIAALLGADFVWSKAPAALLILFLLMAAHWGLGLVAAGLMVAFRTTGPLLGAVMAVSFLFGGVYWPVTSIPAGLDVVARLTPLAYGLGAVRRVFLQGQSLASQAQDVAMLASMAVVLLIVGAAAFQAALRYARRTGALGTY